MPAGWSAPSTTGANAGYTTASSGTLSVAAQTITVSSLTIAGGSTFTITYGSTAGGGPGATATSSTGAQTWQAQAKSTSAGSLANLGASPSITVNAADGSGTLTSGTSAVSASQDGRTITFTYTAPAGGINNGSVTLVVPAGWSAPSTTGANAGYTTSSSGTLSVASQTITVSSLTLAAGNTATITYGDTSGGGAGATATSSTGAQTWQAQAKSTAGGLAREPRLFAEHHRLCGGRLRDADDADDQRVGEPDRQNTHLHVHRAGGRHLERLGNPRRPGRLERTVDHGRERRLLDLELRHARRRGTDHHRLVPHARVRQHGDDHVRRHQWRRPRRDGHVEHRAHRPGRHRPSPPPAGSLANLGASPSVTVYAADGSGSLTTPTTSVVASQTGRTLTFTYTVAAGGISNGSVTLVVPAGWSAPSTTGANAGDSTSSSGTLAAAGQTITVSSLTLAGGNTFTITYGSTAGGGPGATATSSTGAQTWQAQEKSTASGSLANLGASPSVTVYAADGSGTLTTPTTSVPFASTGNSLTFTYTAAAGGISNGSVTLVVPAGWNAPSTTGANGGYSTSSAGSLSVAGQTITVSSLTLAGGNTFTITYGSTAGGGPGATAPSTAGAQTWQAQEKSISTSSLANLASSPSVTVLAFDGSGTLTTPTASVNSAQTGRTITFTYTAATGGTCNGTVTLVVPTGWNAPSTTGANAGYSTSSAGTLTVSGQTITVASLTLGAGSTFTIIYGYTARRWARRHRTGAGRRPDLAGTGEVELRRHADEPRFVSEHHRHRRHCAVGTFAGFRILHQCERHRHDGVHPPGNSRRLHRHGHLGRHRVRHRSSDVRERPGRRLDGRRRRLDLPVRGRVHVQLRSQRTGG